MVAGRKGGGADEKRGQAGRNLEGGRRDLGWLRRGLGGARVRMLASRILEKDQSLVANLPHCELLLLATRLQL